MQISRSSTANIPVEMVPMSLLKEKERENEQLLKQNQALRLERATHIDSLTASNPVPGRRLTQTNMISLV